MPEPEPALTTFLLIRHVAHAVQGHRMVGRMPGIGLGEEGRDQLTRLRARLQDTEAQAIYASPLERAAETAAALGEALGLPVDTVEELIELDYGDWTGRTVEELESEPRWPAWNSFRSGTRVPGGETMIEVQVRVLQLIERLQERYPAGRVLLVTHGDVIRGRVLLVTHGDVIRGLLLHYLGSPTDFIHRLVVDPGSVSTVAVGEHGPRILGINDSGVPA
jgi:broad specificity phosphatase PhoE